MTEGQNPMGAVAADSSSEMMKQMMKFMAEQREADRKNQLAIIKELGVLRLAH